MLKMYQFEFEKNIYCGMDVKTKYKKIFSIFSLFIHSDQLLIVNTRSQIL